MTKTTIPVVKARYLPPDPRNHCSNWEVRCPHCGRTHYHGADSPRHHIGVRDSVGHRLSHCKSGSYVLKPDLRDRETLRAWKAAP